jgi:hypothetical protein
MCVQSADPSVVAMTSYPPSPAPSAPGATIGTLWVLRLLAGLQAIMLIAQPVLAGRFLDGDYPSLATHGTNGLALMGVAWLVLIAAVLAWRPGRLPAWPMLVALACALLLPIQLGMGHARYLAVHLLLGVAIVGTGLALALWAWWPGRARRSFRAPRAVLPKPDGVPVVVR